MASLPLLSLWSKRSLVFHFAIMNIKISFRGSYLGLFWTAVEPLLLFILMYIVFTNIRVVETHENFAIYLISGIVLYHSFVRGTQTGMVSLRENTALLSSIKLRRELFPVVATTTASLLLIVEVAVFFGIMPFAQFIPTWTIALLPIVLGLLLVLILGISYLLSIVYAYAKDIQPFWGVVMTALFFLMPIFWYIEDTAGILIDIQSINPLGQLIEIGHQLVFGTIPPISDWLYTASIIFGILFVGYAFFQRFEKNILEKM